MATLAGAGDVPAMAIGTSVNWFSGPFESGVVAGAESLADLEPEWADLQARAPGSYVSEGVDWAKLCWRARPRGPDERLVCLAVRRGRQLVAVLPLIVLRWGPFRVGRPLACETTEYCPLLVDPSADVLDIWTALGGAIRELAGVDAVVLPNVRDDGPLAPFLAAARPVRRTDSIPCAFLRRSGFASWDAYWRQLPGQVRSNVKRARKRLAQLGEVRFRELTDPGARHAAWAWMIDQKRDWLARKGLDHAFIGKDAYARFTEATLDLEGPMGRRAIFALELDGRLIAAELVSIDRARVEMFVCTYDPEFAHCAPGNLLREHVVRWAFDQGLDYDWRLGGEAYKGDWASDAAAALTYVVPRNGRGRLFADYLAGRTWLANHTPHPLRARIRGVLHGRDAGARHAAEGAASW